MQADDDHQPTPDIILWIYMARTQFHGTFLFLIVMSSLGCHFPNVPGIHPFGARVKGDCPKHPRDVIVSPNKRGFRPASLPHVRSL